MQMARDRGLQIRMNDAEIEILSRYAKDEARNRSEAVREIIRAELIKKGYIFTSAPKYNK